jgi:hypothetical protein
MKGPFFNKIFLLVFFLVISINKTTQSENFELKMIADASLNATASFASFERQNYLYFLYDLNPFLKDNNFRTDTNFKLTSKNKFYSYDISYTFLHKKIGTINSTDIIGNRVYINWRYLADVIANRTLADEYDHYININNNNKLFLKQNNFNTLVLRIKVMNKKGDLTIENLLSLPEDIKKAINNKKNNYIYNKNLMDSLNKDNNNNNYHKNNNNNNQNYHNGIYYNNNNKDYFNNNNNYNYGNNKYYSNSYYHYHYHTHHNKHFHFHNIGLIYTGIIFAQIWTIIFILYCIVNRRKVNNNRFAVIVGNMHQ